MGDPKGEYDSTVGVPIFMDFGIGPIPREDAGDHPSSDTDQTCPLFSLLPHTT